LTWEPTNKCPLQIKHIPTELDIKKKEFITKKEV
jgi:hypothetical protein